MKAFILANISDAFSTLSGLHIGGIELNPFINWAMEVTSIPEALAVKLAAAGMLALLLNRHNPKLLAIPTLVVTLAAINNSLVVLASF